MSETVIVDGGEPKNQEPTPKDNPPVENPPKGDPKPAAEESISKADFLALQQKLNEREKQIEKFIAQQEAEKDAKLKEQGKWEDLYKATEEKLEAERQAREAVELRVKNHAKLSAFLSEAGTLAKPSYEKHIDLDQIEIKDDGTIDVDSVKRYADKFRNDYPELLKKSPSNVPADAAKPNANVTEVPKKYKDRTEMLQEAAKKGILFKKGRGL